MNFGLEIFDQVGRQTVRYNTAQMKIAGIFVHYINIIAGSSNPPVTVTFSYPDYDPDNGEWALTLVCPRAGAMEYDYSNYMPKIVAKRKGSFDIYYTRNLNPFYGGNEYYCLMAVLEKL